ncbi:CoxG family protein [Virgibacillus sp. DJP39]|uniref:CoxG family protein n=1 Tax=Virgibacillus sp. DJP39 TaxID=3409790 RepID=UPI003BB7D5EB
MPSGICKLELETPINYVWPYVSDMNKWAPMVPGYIEHTILSKKQSTWKFKGDIGVVQKAVNLRIDITKWQEPSLVTFNLTGLNENFKGDGYFEARVISGSKTEITCYISIIAKGMMGPLINSFLKSFVPKTTNELTKSIAQKINEVEVVTT